MGRALREGYKWLRAVPPDAFTGPHMDRAYVGSSLRRLTAWIPLGDVRRSREVSWLGLDGGCGSKV